LGSGGAGRRAWLPCKYSFFFIFLFLLFLFFSNFPNTFSNQIFLNQINSNKTNITTPQNKINATA
jgi:hypothetical protein